MRLHWGSHLCSPLSGLLGRGLGNFPGSRGLGLLHCLHSAHLLSSKVSRMALECTQGKSRLCLARRHCTHKHCSQRRLIVTRRSQRIGRLWFWRCSGTRHSCSVRRIGDSDSWGDWVCMTPEAWRGWAQPTLRFRIPAPRFHEDRLRGNDMTKRCSRMLPGV